MLKVQQIEPRIGWYLAGFADGEGSFNISFRPRKDYQMPWKVALLQYLPEGLRHPCVVQAAFRCGTMRQRKDGVWYFEVNNFEAIAENVIPLQPFRFSLGEKEA